MAAEWRDTTFYLRGEFAHYALALAGEFSAITLQLSDEVEAEALKKGGGAKRFLTERMAYHLEAGLGRQVQFWFRLETADVPGSRLHLHGEIGCAPRELPKARAALRKAGGKWDARGARYQAHTTPEPDNGYVSYAFKSDPGQGHRVLRIAREPAWWDAPFMVTSGLKQQSRALYEAVRRSVRLSGIGICNYRPEETPH